MDDDHVEKVFAVIRQNRRLTVREVAEEMGICKSSCHLILIEKQQMRRVAASRYTSLLIHEFLTKHETTVVPQPPYSPDLTPADFFLFPKWKSSPKRSPISDGRGDRRNLNAGPSRCPAKHVPGRVPEMGKKVGSGVLGVEGSTLKATSLVKL